MQSRILIVEDEPDLAELVRFHLTKAGFAAEVAHSGEAGLESIRRARPALVVLDLMLPDVSGIDVCREVRADAKLRDLPILMLTARTEEVDRVVGFELGADDYVTKPFSPRELVLRVRAILRRSEAEPQKGVVLQSGALQLDLERHRCTAGGADVDLTAKEFRLLEVLMSRPGHVMTRQRLLDDVWGSDITVTERTIDTHLKRLREKLGAAGELIETVRGVGYRLSD
jgi:two-component system phosphate regulon response regulator PhoB